MAPKNISQKKKPDTIEQLYRRSKDELEKVQSENMKLTKENRRLQLRLTNKHQFTTVDEDTREAECEIYKNEIRHLTREMEHQEKGFTSAAELMVESFVDMQEQYWDAERRVGELETRVKELETSDKQFEAQCEHKDSQVKHEESLVKDAACQTEDILGPGVGTLVDKLKALMKDIEAVEWKDS